MDLVRLKPNIEVLDIEDEGVLVDMDNGRYLALNGTGYEIASALGQVTNRAELIDRLMDKFDATRSEVEADLREFESNLVSLNLTNLGESFSEEFRGKEEGADEKDITNTND